LKIPFCPCRPWAKAGISIFWGSIFAILGDFAIFKNRLYGVKNAVWYHFPIGGESTFSRWQSWASKSRNIHPFGRPKLPKYPCLTPKSLRFFEKRDFFGANFYFLIFFGLFFSIFSQNRSRKHVLDTTVTLKRMAWDAEKPCF